MALTVAVIAAGLQPAGAADKKGYVLKAEAIQAIEAALPAQATAKPLKPRRLLIYTRNDYDGHNAAIAASNEAFTRMGKKHGAFETVISSDPAIFKRESLTQFDAVFLNNTIGHTCDDPALRANLLEFVTGGGGLMGNHGAVIAFTKDLWPAQEDWPEFGYMLGARGYAHHHGNTDERITVAVNEPTHPIVRVFNGQSFEMSSEFFRHHEPYSRNRVRVLLSIDADKTDLSRYQPGDPCLRADNDYALAWVRRYGQGRVFYTSIGHGPEIFANPKMLQFFQDAIQFVLGDLEVPTTPSAYLSPAVLAQEKLGWRIGVEAYTFHKFTFFETIEKTAELGLPYIGGLSFMQRVSKDIPKDFNQNLSDDELRQIRLKMESAGVRLLTFYAQNIPNDEPGCRKLFEFGRKMGIETFMCEPRADQLDLLDKLANEYGINIAIHNHGPNISPNNWNPEQVLALCQGRSKRIGAAPDLGYWLRNGVDPVEAVRLLKDRILTVQMHDLHERSPHGHDVPWGTGAGESEAFFRELLRYNVKPTMIGLEYSYDFLNNFDKVAQCVTFFNDITLKLAEESHETASDDSVTDVDGNVYGTVKIGRQVWTTSNLRTTRFNDGSPIPQITGNEEWKAASGPAFCYFDNNPENAEPAGLLYNWYAASSPKIAPKGWRVPTREEQLELRDYLIANGFNYDETTEGNKIAKAMSDKEGWLYKTSDEFGKPVPDLIGMTGNLPETNNRTGYSARPAGSRWAGWGDGKFHSRPTSVYWWSVTPYNDTEAYHTSIHTWHAKYGDNHHQKEFGFSIRLIRDEAQ
jgi:uncharacterized protein (TIGR02145 family)